MFFPPFIIPIVVGVFTQLLKPLFNRNWNKEHHGLEMLPQYGGMPSAHTAFATSLATIVSLTDGINSVTFAIAICVMIFILDDALSCYPKKNKRRCHTLRGGLGIACPR
jgi:acid phosphatase family membrane protein YuiD